MFFELEKATCRAVDLIVSSSAHGVYANVRLEDEENQRQCMLVLMGATADGRKELIAVVDGFRENKQS